MCQECKFQLYLTICYCAFRKVTFIILFISSFRHFNVKKMYPIEIGTVPLYYQSTSLSHNSVTPYVPSAPPVDQISPVVQQMPQPITQPIGFVIMSPPYPTTSTPQSMPCPEMRKF